MWIAAWLGAAASAQGLTREELDAILTFRAEHLEVREIDTLIPGRVAFVRSGWGWGPRRWPGHRWGTPDVIATPPALLEGWAVVQGPRTLTVPEYLDIVGREVEAVDLERRIRRNRGVGNVFNGLAVAGLGAGIGGLVATIAAPGAMEPTWTGVSLGGFGSAILSSIVGGAARTRAARLTEDYTVTQELDAVQVEVREHNEALRKSLGLTPEQAYRELDGRRRPDGS